MANYVKESSAKNYICDLCKALYGLYPHDECPKDKKDNCFYMKELDKNMIYLHSENAPQL